MMTKGELINQLGDAPNDVCVGVGVKIRKSDLHKDNIYENKTHFLILDIESVNTEDLPPLIFTKLPKED